MTAPIAEQVAAGPTCICNGSGKVRAYRGPTRWLTCHYCRGSGDHERPTPDSGWLAHIIGASDHD